jgi:hypothetical protein
MLEVLPSDDRKVVPLESSSNVPIDFHEVASRVQSQGAIAQRITLSSEAPLARKRPSLDTATASTPP